MDADWVELDATIFYPMGGGQPVMPAPSNCTLATASLPGARYSREVVQFIHQLESADHGLAVGVIDTEIDWERRYRHMRMHTSMHLLGFR